MKFLRVISLLILAAFLRSLDNLPATGDIKAAILNYYKNYPREKIYLQSDEPVYAAGQTIWFKIYATAYGKPSALSRIVYVQLVDHKGAVLIRKKFLLDQGCAYGSMDLPDSMHSGSYQLRSFTEWMLNFGEPALFHKQIFIGGYPSPATGSAQASKTGESYETGFFPEGGYLVDSTMDNLAFTLTNHLGQPVNATGLVMDGSTDTLAMIHTHNDGRGTLILPAFSNRHYYALWQLPGHSVQPYPLPEVRPAGIALQVTGQTAQDIRIKIMKHALHSGEYEEIKLAAWQDNGKVAVYPLQLDREVSLFNVRKTGFSSGILHLAVFGPQEIPLAERILFIRNKDQLHLRLSAASLDFRPRGRSAFTLRVSDDDGNPVKGNFSVAITDADLVRVDSVNDNIYSGLLLSPGLNKPVPHPGIYFGKSEDSLRQSLDLLLQTADWPRFDWQQLFLSKPLKLTYPVEETEYLAGRVTNKAGKSVPPGKVTVKLIIHNADSSRFIGYATPDSNGNFALKDFNVYGDAVIDYQILNGEKPDKSLEVKFYTSPADSLQTAPFYAYPPEDHAAPLSPAFFEAMKNERQRALHLSGNALLLKPVVIKSAKRSKTDKLVSRLVSPHFRASSAYNIDLEDNRYPENRRLYDFLRGRFPGLDIYGDEDHPEFHYEGAVPQMVKKTSSLPYFYVNEVPATYENVRDIPLSDIALIRFIPPPAPMAPFNGGFTGVIALYLKRGRQSGKMPGLKGSYAEYVFHGFSRPGKFDSPDYGRPGIPAAGRDTRTTLYWNPLLLTGSTGEARFSFYNSDIASRYHIIIEGITADGRIGRLDTTVAVGE